MREGRPSIPVDTEWLVNQVAHALRNPIFAAQVQIEALMLRLGQQPDAQRPVATLQRQLRRLEETVNEMLLYGRPTRVSRAPVELVQLVAAVAAAYCRGERQEPAEVSVQPAVLSLPARTDAGAVRTILERLLDNAVQHTEPPHRVEVVVAPPVDGRATLVVRDHGEGIPDDLRDRVTLPFFPQHRGRPGLGLAVASKLAAALGGSLAVDSRPGEGTEVRLVLPLDVPE